MKLCFEKNEEICQSDISPFLLTNENPMKLNARKLGY